MTHDACRILIISQAGFSQHEFENPIKTIIQKGNALLGLGRFDEAKECYESLRELGENSAADQHLKKLHDTQEKDIRCFWENENFYTSKLIVPINWYYNSKNISK